ncbi:MAG: hypothetical protein PHE55_11085, partial [Methylococcaceae bacterium]|nr:hypothetical protein [Methylococcaceae bacterium]
RFDGICPIGWSRFIQIDTATYVQLVAAHHPAGYTEAFGVTSAGDLIQIWQDPETSEWHFDPVDIPVRMEVEQYASYQVSVFAYDGGGLPLANQPVTLYCDTDLTVEVNGKTCFIDPLTPWPDTTNANGQLTVTLCTGSLGVPQLRVTVDGLGVTALVDPSGPTQDRLANLTEEQLKAANWTSDAGVQTPVIPSGTEDETVAALVNTANSAMRLVEQTREAYPAAMSGRLHPRNDHRVVRFIENTDAAPTPIPPFRITDLAYQEAWQVTFLETGLRYHTLDREQAELALAQYRTLPKTADIFGYDLDWGDVLQVVEDGLAIVEDFTVNAFNGTISWSFKLVVNGIETAFEAIVEGAEQLVNLVELVFEKIAAAFDELFRWLGYIFNWPDIVRTHDQVKFVMNQTFQFSQTALTFVKEKIDGGFDGLSEQVQQAFDVLKSNPFINDSSLTGLRQSNQALAPADMQDAMDNDVVRSAFMANAQNASSMGGRRLASPEAMAVTEDLIATLENYANEFKDANEAFQQALDYFRKATEHPDQFLQNSIKGVLSLVETLALAVLDTVRVVLDAVLDAAAALLEAIWSTLNETWDIPFISDLYKTYVSGNELTMLDVIALLIAVPTTVLYKILRGTAPFPEGDQNGIANFQSQFSLSRLLEGSGMGPGKLPIPLGGEALTSTALLSGPALLIYSIMGVASSTCLSYLVALADASQALENPGLELFSSSAVLVFEILDQGLNIPWLTDDLNYDNTSDVLAITLWSYGFVGCAVDAAFLLGKKKLSRLDSPIVPVFLDSIGMALIGCQFGFSYQQPSDKLALAQNLFGSIPGLFAFLSVEELNADPPKAGIIILTGIDEVCMLGTLVSGIISIKDVAQSLDAA